MMLEAQRCLRLLVAVAVLALCRPAPAQIAADSARHLIPNAHPRLLGSAEELKLLSRERPEAWARVLEVARGAKGDDHSRMLSLSLAYVVEGDTSLGRQAVDLAFKYIDGPIRVGHVRFGDDLANCAIVYDLCWPLWAPQQKLRFHEYMNRTVDENVRSETSVFHNAWYSYKNWGFGLACYATYYENLRAAAILGALEQEFRNRVVPAFQLAGDGGGWAEGYYVHYWSYEWMFFCEAARRCEGLDYFAMSPEFLGRRAIADMFECYPGLREDNTRRPIPMGDGGGTVLGSDRDKTLCARRILVNRFRDDPDHQVVQAFNEITPSVAAASQAYKDFLWRDTTVAKGSLASYKLSQISRGPGFVYARSSWEDDATYFFFKCGDRFTAHQHLDNGQFLIYKYEELAGDGGYYDAFESNHAVNYYLRTVAHNSILVYDPQETWPQIRAFQGPVANDGGQLHNWPHHNGTVEDAQAWEKDRELYDIADILAFEDRGDYLYVAGDCSRSYSPKKLEYFTRQIVFLRPGTFVIFDRVKSTRPEFKKTWLLQTSAVPEDREGGLVVTNGKGRLFIQTILPRDARVELHSGDSLYAYGGAVYKPDMVRGRVPECRVEVSPSVPDVETVFLHVLTATEAGTRSVARAQAADIGREVTLTVGRTKIVFARDRVGGSIEMPGIRRDLSATIAPD
jgi:hypothetical protein